MIIGTPASPGFGAGPAMILRDARKGPRQVTIDDADKADELARFDAAVAAVIDELSRTEAQLASNPPSETGSIATALIVSHRAVLQDPLLVGGVHRHIQRHGRNAEWALECVVDELRNAMFALENPNLRDWWHDVEALANTLQDKLGRRDVRLGFPTGTGVVAVAHSLGIADTIELIESGGAAMVLEKGSLTSHVAVLCRSCGLPAVVGASDAGARLQNGRVLVVDGDTGRAWHDDDAATTTPTVSRVDESGPLTTACGVPITLRANVSLRWDADRARASGTHGVGLMRTFYQYVGRSELPTEDELEAIYRQVLTDFAPQPVNVRLLDLGGSFGAEELPAELRNLRDCRGIRLVQERRAVVMQQLRAMCRASDAGTLRILVPFVTDPEEVATVRDMVIEAMCDVSGDDGAQHPIPVGAMIEVPSAVLLIDDLAPLCDFFAIGTNDLSQYTLARSRDEAGTDLANIGLHRAVLRAIRHVVDAGKRHGVGVSLCGEIASQPAALPALLAAGLREFSVAPRLAPAVRATVRTISLDGEP